MILNGLKCYREIICRRGIFDALEFKNFMESMFESEGFRQNSSEIRNILIIHDAGIGDFVNLSSSIRAIRQKFPESRITLICDSSTKFLARSCPYVDSIFYNPKNLDWSDLIDLFDWQIEFVQNLLPVKFDLAFCFCHRTAGILLSYMSGAKKIIHYSGTVICSPDHFELRMVNPLINLHITIDFTRPHIADRYLGMVDGFFQTLTEARELEVWYEPRCLEKAQQMLGDFYGKKIFAVVMSGATLDKHYPPEKYAQLARKISEEIPDARFINLGGSMDVESGEIFAREFGDPERVLNLAGQTNYSETAAILSMCEMYIGNDSSVKHVSAALKIPCLEPNCFPRDHELQFDSSPMMYFPYLVPSVTVMPEKSLPECVDSTFFRGCKIQNQPHCITQITVEKMFEGFNLLRDKIQREDNLPSFIF